MYELASVSTQRNPSQIVAVVYLKVTEKDE